MTAGTLRRILALGAITGMRSMAGAATLAAQHGGVLKPTIALPQIGRAVMGTLVGGFIAHEEGQSVWLGALAGAAAAVAATHLAYQLRTRLPLPMAVSGLAEDAFVVGAGTRYLKH